MSRATGSAAARRLAALLALTFAVGCAMPAPPAEAPPPTPRLDPAAAAERLPDMAAGFTRRGQARALLEQGSGLEVAYATQGRVAAAAIIQLVQLPGAPVPDGLESPAMAAALEAVLRDSLQTGSPHRRLRETRRFSLPAGPAPLLRCVALQGEYGRDPVEGIACAGAANGLVLRLRATMPRRSPPIADSGAFATEIAATLRR